MGRGQPFVIIRTHPQNQGGIRNMPWALERDSISCHNKQFVKALIFLIIYPVYSLLFVAGYLAF